MRRPGEGQARHAPASSLPPPARRRQSTRRDSGTRRRLSSWSRSRREHRSCRRRHARLLGVARARCRQLRSSDLATGAAMKLQVQPQCVQDGEHLVQLHRLLAAFQGIDEPLRHAGKVCDLVLPQAPVAARTYGDPEGCMSADTSGLAAEVRARRRELPKGSGVSRTPRQISARPCGHGCADRCCFSLT